MYVLAPNQNVEKFPYSIGDLRKDNPQVSFPANPSLATLAAYNVYPVVSTGAQYDPATQVATQEGCTYTGTRWETAWTVRDKTAEELQADALGLQQEIVDATQQRLDDFAATRNYDGILSLCTYATSTVPKFQTEGQYGVEARDATWAKLYEMLAEVQAGTRPMPTGYADVEPELPVLEWP
jgi:hypothetical protein